MALKQLKARAEIHRGKGSKPIKPGTIFKATDEAEQEHLLKGLRPAAEVYTGSDEAEDAPKPKAKKAAAKEPAPAPAPEGEGEGEGGDDLPTEAGLKAMKKDDLVAQAKAEGLEDVDKSSGTVAEIAQMILDARTNSDDLV